MADAGRSSRRARTTEDGGAGRCLSDLSDDLLRHILFLAPDKDGAATAVLSRRWRWLWRTSGAVYLDSGSFTGGCSSPAEEAEAFYRGAEEALAAAAANGGGGGPIRRLTFSIAKDSVSNLRRVLHNRSSLLSRHNLMETLVSNLAVRRVEELHVDFKSQNVRYTLRVASLPYEALRVLRIVSCAELTAPDAEAAAFPMLVDLHLQNCSVPLVDLQRIIDAAPQLSALHLASTNFATADMRSEEMGRLVIPAVSALVLADCTYGYGYRARLELDVPRLQSFTYNGHLEHTNLLSLKSQASANMVRVDLHLTHQHNHYYSRDETTPACEFFLRFLQNFSTAKFLKLRVEHFSLNNLAFTHDKADRDDLLLGGSSTFSLLEQLELEAAEYDLDASDASMVMLADLLHCCPVLRDLRIKFIKQNRRHWEMMQCSYIENEARIQFDKSVTGFRNHRRGNRSMVSLGRENVDNHQAYYRAIPGLTSERPFSCLQSHLKRVSLQFFMEEDNPNCLGVQVAAFFAKNAMVLQELHIDDGSQEMLEHVNSSVRRWIIAGTADNSINKLNEKKD